jgi:hypothetical protein
MLIRPESMSIKSFVNLTVHISSPSRTSAVICKESHMCFNAKRSKRGPEARRPDFRTLSLEMLKEPIALGEKASFVCDDLPT